MTKASFYRSAFEMQRLPIKAHGRPITLEYWYGASAVPHKYEGCCSRLKLYEENSRFLLLALIMALYMLCGAAIFHFIEEAQEQDDRLLYETVRDNFTAKYANVSLDDLYDLLWAHGNASQRGFHYERKRWDFPGSFYFVGTVVAAIGYGMTAPRTTAGKVLVIFYGFFGCAGAILFFNLFLERVITVIAYFLRCAEQWCQCYRKKDVPSIHVSDTESVSSVEAHDGWKPSVYRVWACLTLVAIALMLIAACTYSYIENWSYFEALYYCFVSFATIGFGDYVASQQEANHAWVFPYRILHAIFLVLGCSCIYSLFNVTSIIIRQQLNRLIKCLDCRCQPKNWPLRKQRRPYLGLGLSQKLEADQMSSGDPSSRKSSEGMISLKDFLGQNQLSMLMFQKHLINKTDPESPSLLSPTSHPSPFYANSAISASSIGPIAMLTKQFGE